MGIIRFSRPVSYTLLIAIHVFLALSFLADRSPNTNAAASGFPLDDAWIHLVYGREIALHGLPYYNTGELEAGFTSPTWILGTGFAELLQRVSGISPVATVKALGVLTAAAASLLLFELNLVLTGNPLISFVIAGIAAGTPLIAFSQLSGMEVGLGAALLLAAIMALERRRYLAAGICCGLAYLTRPESVVLLPVLLVGLALVERKRTPWLRSNISCALRLGLPVLIAAAAWALFCLSVNGHPLPNTYYAKFEQVNAIGNFTQIFKEIVLGLPLNYLFCGTIVYVAGVAGLFGTSRVAGLVAAVLPWAFFAAVAASRSMPVGCGTYFYWWRYVIPVLPALFIPVAVGANLLWRFAGGEGPWSLRSGGGRRKALAALGLVVVLAVPLSRYPAQLSFRRQQYSWNCQNMNEVQVAFGEWVNRNVSPDAAVLVLDAGAIRYFGKRKTIDLMGLNNHELLFDRTMRARLQRDPLQVASYMSSLHASHIIIFPSVFPRLVRNPNFASRFKAEASYGSANYTVSGARQDMMVAYRLVPGGS